MPDMVAYSTAGLLTESGQGDLTAYASAGLLGYGEFIPIYDGELIAPHRVWKLLAEERSIELAARRDPPLAVEVRVTELSAEARIISLLAEDRVIEIYADEERTWQE
jgi:hypothetical protein